MNLQPSCLDVFTNWVPPENGGYHCAIYIVCCISYCICTGRLALHGHDISLLVLGYPHTAVSIRCCQLGHRLDCFFIPLSLGGYSEFDRAYLDRTRQQLEDFCIYLPHTTSCILQRKDVSSASLFLVSTGTVQWEINCARGYY